jgi:hypothetical protein
MRFLEEGANIPDDLIRAVTRGDAVFLCGAGVSRRVGLPSFRRLTELVYQKIGENYVNEPAERCAFERDEFDRALRSLEKRTHHPKTASRVRLTVSELLMASDDLSLPDHLALLQLSRDSEGRSKLLTTNFDTLFERAAHAAKLGDIPSYAGKSIPRPGGAHDHGILHLHGRIADTSLKILETDLVLTSADFGDAYLRDGWASRYIEDRMRISILVLVGYGAEDAALRLLLETLDADRDRFPDLKDIYAIEKGTDDSASMWKSKGIKPIEFTDYDEICSTLSEWARYTLHPIEYGQDRVKSILMKPKKSVGS